jgi:hypothetical protein
MNSRYLIDGMAVSKNNKVPGLLIHCRRSIHSGRDYFFQQFILNLLVGVLPNTSAIKQCIE